LAPAHNFDTFHQFPRLAPELRLKVWYEALPLPAIVEIDFCFGIRQWYSVKESQVTPCGLLLACKDSRDTYLKHYVSLFKQNPTTPFIDKTGGRELHGACGHNYSARNTTPIAYFNPLVDTLYIGANAEENFNVSIDALEYLQQVPSLAKVRFLGCESKELRDGLEYTSAPTPLFLFPSLEEFSVIEDDYNPWAVANGLLRPGGQIEWFGEQTEWLGDPMKGDETFWAQLECQQIFRDLGKEAIQRGYTSPLPKLFIRRITRGCVLPQNCDLVNLGTNGEDDEEDEEEEDSDETEDEEEEEEEEEEDADADDEHVYGEEYNEDYDEETSSDDEKDNSN
jgi:hypothetical protein